MTENQEPPKNSTYPRYIRFIIFIIMTVFVFVSIQKISDFFGIDYRSSYAYFLWASLLMFLFVMLPIERSVFTNLKKNNNKENMYVNENQSEAE